MLGAAEAFLCHPPLVLAEERCPPDTKAFPHLQVLLGKLEAMLRGQGSQEEMRVGSKHGRISAWVQQPLGHT